MNKKNILFLSIVFLLIIFALSNRNGKVIKLDNSTKKSNYSVIYRANYGFKNSDYLMIRDLTNSEILNTLFLDKYYDYIMTSLIINNMDDLAEKYAKKVLDKEYNDIAISIILFNSLSSKNSDLEPILNRYKDEDSIYLKKLKFIIDNKDKKIFLDENNIFNKELLTKYNAMKLEISGNIDEAIKLYKTSLDEKFLMNTLLLFANLNIKNGDKDALSEFDNLTKTANTFIYDEFISKIKMGKFNINQITYKNIVAEFMFDNSFINKELEIVLPYLSYKLDKAYELPLILEISNLDSKDLFAEALYMIDKNIDKVVMKDILESQRINILLKNGNNSKKTLKSFKELSNKYPSNLFNYIKIAYIYEEMGNIKKAIRIYDDALNNLSYNDRKNWIIYFNRGVLYDKIGDWDMAELNLKKALQLNPNNPALLNYLGYSWLTKNQNKHIAVNMIKASLNSEPFNSEFIDSLGWGLYLTGDSKSALEYLEPAKMVNNQSAIINYHLAVVYEDLKRYREALYQYKKALRFNEQDNSLKDEEIKKSKDKIKVLIKNI
ncbi:MAG: tetratricopeptide repeat protein [Alphaproteobacteria bacterium]|jgi:tetratricopeptide (TPR) repeat protein|nr:tetratricopeptide repeat protein [Alphaproteobacteria bacterium]